ASIDLLRALMDEEEGQAATLARAAGVTWDKLRGVLPAVPVAAEAPISHPRSDEVTLAMSSAHEFARLYAADGTVASDHLLLAILDADASLRALLESVGLDFASLRERIAPALPPIHLDRPFDLAPA